MDGIGFEYLYTVEGYITFVVNVKAGAFSGAAGFCMADCWLKDAISNLSELYRDLRGKYRMDDYDSDDFICFEMEQSGHMTVTGQVGGSYNDTFLTYEYRADQTMLAEIIKKLRIMLALRGSPEEYLARKQPTE